MSDEKFLLEYERLLDKGYCDCNEMNCIDNDSPKRILRIAKNLQQENKELKKQLQKYKSLYQNEKDKNDTLVRIVKKIEEKIKKHLNFRDYSYHKYELFGREYFEELLDLLKEIK